MDKIANRVKLIRTDWVLSQVEFAKRIGVTNAHISAIEKGKTMPSQAIVKLICKEFKVNEQWLRTGTGPRDEQDFNLATDDKMEDAMNKISKLLRNDGFVRALAAEINHLFAQIINLETDDDSEIGEYLNICYRMMYHINNYLDFKKKAAGDNQTYLLPYPNDISEDLKRDFEDFENYFKNSDRNATPSNLGDV